MILEVTLDRPRVAIFNNTSVEHHLGSYFVTKTIVDLVKDGGGEPVLLFPTDRSWIRYLPKLRSLDLDLIIVNGEGSIHDNAPGTKGRELLLLPLLAISLGVPIVLINASIHSIEKVDFKLLSLFNMIFVREASEKEVESLIEDVAMKPPHAKVFRRAFAELTGKSSSSSHCSQGDAVTRLSEPPSAIGASLPKSATTTQSAAWTSVNAPAGGASVPSTETDLAVASVPTGD